MLFLTKVRIDLGKLGMLGKKLRDGSLDTSAMEWTYCHQADPSVGVSLWQADDREHLAELLAPMREFYAEVMEITPVVASVEAEVELVRRLTP